jgi:hypothetical protein|tara:strand:+ start:41888 stop:42109 length:222 start_codon:yes stop_codon:yes gene_type:complete
MTQCANLALACTQPNGYAFEQSQNNQSKEASLQGNDYELTETHVSIYHGYVNFVKWGTISIIALLVLMAIFLL